MNNVTARAHPPDIYSCTRVALAARLRAHGHKPTQASHLFAFLYRQQPAQLSPALSACLARHWHAELPTLAQVSRSTQDGTVKLLLQLTDKLRVETVIICEKKRMTLCISTQVGCAQRCAFCQTGRMGMWRNLSAGEIVAQYLLARQWLQQSLHLLADFTQASIIANVVFMGMGEPLDNLSAVIDSIAIFTDPYGLALAPRRIAVSTVGNPKALRRLLGTYPSLPLALSVHAADSHLRARLMPAERKWPLSQVLQVLRNFPRCQLLVQYTLLAGVNDTEHDAVQLARLLRGLPAKLNLIVYNPIEGGKFMPASTATVRAFQNLLFQHGCRAMIRFSKGNDIGAACGQLWARQQ